MTFSGPGLDDKLACLRLPEPTYAFGMAVDLLRLHKPFADFKFGRLASVIRTQIRRNHFVFTFRGSKPVGYAGWALCSHDIAKAWIERRYVPKYEDCLRGEYWVGITFYAENREVTFFQSRYCRKLYPNAKVAFLRDYGGVRRRMTETVNRIRSDEPPAGNEPLLQDGT